MVASCFLSAVRHGVIRRTGYPSTGVPGSVGYYPQCAETAGDTPSTEVNHNPYYKDEAGTDTHTEKLFWAK